MLTHKNLINTISSLGISHITTNSEDVTKNTAFFAIKGTYLDGHEYIDSAISNGARLIVTHKPYIGSASCPIIVVEDTRDALSDVAEFLYPKNPEHLVAVTGTNGKTSVVNYFWQICELLSKKSVAIGTIGVTSNDEALKKSVEACGEVLTTPDVITTRKMLNLLASQGIEYVSLEASSHGIDQRRIGNMKVDSAALTNITHEHLDYHGSFEVYRDTKLKLFTEHLKQDGVAVISTDCNDLNYIISYLKDRKIKHMTVGKDGDLDILSCDSDITKQRIEYVFLNKKHTFQTNIVGSFQANNILVAAMLAVNCGLELNDVVSTLPYLKAVRGRLERVTKLDDEFQVFVDYAHTPDALEKSLLELSKLPKNRLFVLFGCGGDRDKEKRPMMGKIASQIADVVIVTDDNPRTEDPVLIRDEISQDIPQAIKIAGRKEAIEYAITHLDKGDILLIAGKGHEDYQIIGHTKNPFDDVQIVRNILSKS